LDLSDITELSEKLKEEIGNCVLKLVNNSDFNNFYLRGFNNCMCSLHLTKCLTANLPSVDHVSLKIRVNEIIMKFDGKNIICVCILVFLQ